MAGQNPKSRRDGERGQAAIEMAFLVPVMMLLMFGVFQLARVFYTYHTLQKAFRGGAGMLARANNVNFCDPSDPTLANAPNFIIYGNLQGQGTPVVQGLTADMIQIVAERVQTGTSTPAPCPCGSGASEPDSCDFTTGGRPPDFVVVNDVGGSSPLGFPVSVLLPYVNLGTMNLKVSIRMAVTGD